MSNQATKPPGPGFGAGHTGQYITLAEGLRQAAEAMEADWAYLEKKGFSVSIASLRFEARCATIAVISAALCECIANTILASTLSAVAFAEAEKESMPRKWSHLVPRALSCAPPDGAAIQELWRLHQTRNSIVHAKATIFTDGENLHIQGNDPQWIHLTPQIAREFIGLPLRLAETIPASGGILYMIGCSLRERQPRLPRVHVAEILTALELIPSSQRQAVRAALDRMDADDRNI